MDCPISTEFYESLGQFLGDRHAQWVESLRTRSEVKLKADSHGMLPKWGAALARLPDLGLLDLNSTSGRGEVVVSQGPKETFDMREILMEFHPWRKGPFEIFGLKIDTEWRSNWKWDRMAKAIDFAGKRVLDVGCGNGYYGWKMLAAGADWVLGCDPFLLYLMQFEIFRKYAPQPEQHFVLPLADNELPDKMQAFDMTLSMGVLYHRTSPIDHLQKLHGTLRPDGELVLETLVIDNSEPTVLVPRGRYAKMRNVWFIPSLAMLELWLKRCRFQNVRLLDVSQTTTKEQRRTEWMTFESLADFLDPNDRNQTIEGYPAPRRALMVANASKT